MRRAIGGVMGLKELAMLHGTPPTIAERLEARKRQLRGLIDAGQEHRPSDAPTLRVAACELASRGMTARDIASALRLSEAAVRQMLAWEAA